MTTNTITWNSVRDEILSNPEVKVEYDALSPEFELARAVILNPNYKSHFKNLLQSGQSLPELGDLGGFQ